MNIFDSEFFGKTNEQLSENYFAAVAKNGTIVLLDISSEPFEEINVAYNPMLSVRTQDMSMNIDHGKIIIGSTSPGTKINLLPAVTVELNELLDGITSCALSRQHDRSFISTTTGSSLIDSTTGSVIATTALGDFQRAKFTVTDGTERLFAIRLADSRLYELDAGTLTTIRSISAPGSMDDRSHELDVSDDGTRLAYIDDHDIVIRNISDPGANWTLIGNRISEFYWNRHPQGVSFINGSTDLIVGGIRKPPIFSTRGYPEIRRVTQAGVVLWEFRLSTDRRQRGTHQVRRLRVDKTGQYFSFSVDLPVAENNIRRFDIRRTSNSSLVHSTFISQTANDSIACGFSFG